MLMYSVVINVRRPENLMSLAGIAVLLLVSWLVSSDRANVSGGMVPGVFCLASSSVGWLVGWLAGSLVG